MQLTKEDLQEFNESLQRLISGDTTLIDQLGAIQLVCYKNAYIQVEKIFIIKCNKYHKYVLKILIRPFKQQLVKHLKHQLLSECLENVKHHNLETA